MAKRAVRIHQDLDQRMQKAAKDRGFRTPSAFIRAAIESEVKSRNEIVAFEEQMAKSFDRAFDDFRRVLRSQQALFSLIDSLTRVVLTCVPEPDDHVRAQAVSAAKDRYARLIKSAGQAMAADALPAMEALLKHVKELEDEGENLDINKSVLLNCDFSRRRTHVNNSIVVFKHRLG